MEHCPDVEEIPTYPAWPYTALLSTLLFLSLIILSTFVYQICFLHEIHSTIQKVTLTLFIVNSLFIASRWIANYLAEEYNFTKTHFYCQILEAPSVTILPLAYYTAFFAFLFIRLNMAKLLSTL